MVSRSSDSMMSRPRDSMMSTPRALFFVGIVTLSITGAVAALATARSHTVQGELTTSIASVKSVSCDQFEVRAEVWSVTRIAGPVVMGKMGSTTAQGETLGDGCSYNLTFNYLPWLPLPPSFQYRYSAEAPVPKEVGSTIGYSQPVSNPFPEQFDMPMDSNE